MVRTTHPQAKIFDSQEISLPKIY